MDRGSRLLNFFQVLEKINSQRLVNKLGSEDLQQLRYATSKILLFVGGQEKVHRDMIMKNMNYLDSLLLTLENSGDTCTQQNVVDTLMELLGKSHTGQKARTLVSHGATHVLLQLMVYESRDPDCSEDLIISVHQLLTKLGPKDRKFGVKARLTQAVGVTLGLVRNYLSNPKLLQPCVHVLKLYSSNAVNASYLGKNGAVSLLFKVISVCARKHLSCLKYALDSLSLLVKSKSNSARAVGQGGVATLLNMFYDWHKSDTKNRHISLRKSILSVLKHLTNLKCGRKALTDVDGIRVLYVTSQESSDCRELENVIVLASVIMRKCFPRNRLPINSLSSPVSYPLPQSDFHIPDTADSPGDNGYESSLDNDDDISSDDDLEAPKLGSEDDGEGEVIRDVPYHRTAEDLLMYKQFFPELFEFEDVLEQYPLYVREKAILISDSLYDTSNNHHYDNDRYNQSALTLENLHPIDKTSRCVALKGNNGEEEFLSSALHGMKFTHSNDYNMTAANNSGQFLQRPKFKGLLGDNSDFTRDTTQSVSAVNLKTGSSVFSLDISPRTPKKTLQTRSPKPKRKNGRMKGSVKDKKSKGKNKMEDSPYVPPLSITQVSTSKSRDSEDDHSPEPDDENVTGSGLESPELYAEVASRTRSVGRFNKLAYPDMHGQVAPTVKEYLFEKPFGIQREKIFEDIDRFINPDQVIDKVVYDLESIIATAGPTYRSVYSSHANRDELRDIFHATNGNEVIRKVCAEKSRLSGESKIRSPHINWQIIIMMMAMIRVGKQLDLTGNLKFNSQFESGNLRKAIQVRNHEYDLILNPDVNTNHHHQWFYFEVSNMQAGVPYRFNIVNCEKLNSQFNFGMQPVMYSVAEALAGRPSWRRVGSEICYYKNHFVRSSQTTGGVRGKLYYTATFVLTFQHDRDVCYLAYHYPYTYSMLQYHLYQWEKSHDPDRIYLRNQTLCETISGNAVPVLTITAQPQKLTAETVQQFRNRPYIFLSARVHPGESNASWVMRGTINFLLSDRQAAQNLREMYIFKIVPMLNPDGVINGNHRCSLVAEDLNRCWLHPCPKMHVPIYHTKGLLQYLNLLCRSPLVYCDYHGHSRKKNVFLYGCSPSQSWLPVDTQNPTALGNRLEDTGYKTLARILQNTSASFSLNNCSYVVEKSKESTARVVVWRQMGVVRSYTMESSYCGCDQGPYRGCHISTRELEEMGRKFCEGLSKLKSRQPKGGSVASLQTTLDISQSTGDLTAQPDIELEGATAAGFESGHRMGSNTSSSSTDSEAEEDEEEELDDTSYD